MCRINIVYVVLFQLQFGITFIYQLLISIRYFEYLYCQCLIPSQTEVVNSIAYGICLTCIGNLYTPQKRPGFASMVDWMYSATFLDNSSEDGLRMFSSLTVKRRLHSARHYRRGLHSSRNSQHPWMEPRHCLEQTLFSCMTPMASRSTSPKYASSWDHCVSTN